MSENTSGKSSQKTIEDFIVNSKITDFGWKYIMNLAKTVATRYYHTYDIEDLVSLAIVDLAEFLVLIDSGDNKPRSIRNVLFTRARNSMSNYLYHRRKAVTTEDELLDTQTSDEYLTVEFPYTFSTLEEAHWMSLELWQYFLGSKETLKNYGGKMKEPGKLLKIHDLSERETGQLADLLDNLSGSNNFKVLENFLGDGFLIFLDIFAGEDFKIPAVNKILLRSQYLKIYNDSQKYDLDYLAKKYKKSPSTINEIIQGVHQELEQQGGDTNDDSDEL